MHETITLTLPNIHRFLNKFMFMFILCCNTLSFDWRMCAFVVLGSVFAHQAKRLALACGNVSEITHFVSSGTKKPNSVNQSYWQPLIRGYRTAATVNTCLSIGKSVGGITLLTVVLLQGGPKKTGLFSDLITL